MSPPVAPRGYVGSRLTIAEALRHAAAALRELGAADATTEDESDASELELVADRIARRGREEVTAEFPIPEPFR